MMSEDSSTAGTDNLPPMLEESDYESWKICIEWYIKGKTHGKLIWKSILNEPSAYPQITDPEPTSSPAGIVMQPRDKRDEEFTDAENLKELCNIQAPNILSQGLPRWIFNTLNQTQSYEEHALKKLKKQEHSSSVVDPLAYLVKTTHQQAPTHSTTTSPSQLTPALTSTSSSIALSHDDAMLATMKQIANLLSVHDGQITTESIQRRALGNQNNGQGVNNKKKVICYNCRGEGHVARQCKEPKRPKDSLWHQDKAMLLQAKENGVVNHEDAYDSDVDDEPNAAAAFMANLSSISSQINEVRTFNDNIFETVSPSWPSEVQQDEHLDSDEDSVHEDNTIPYDQYLATKESQDVPTEASPILPTAAYMLQTNAELEQETELLQTTLRNKEATIASLTNETKTVLFEKKTLKDKYLKEIVCLKSANQVATGLLQKFQMPTHTIPMLSKRKMIASNDIHKTVLGFSNPWYSKKAQLAQPTLYDGHRLLQPGHAPVTIPDSHETLLETEVGRMKMSQKPGHITPVYWHSTSDIASQSSDPPKPVTPFVHTRPVNSKLQERDEIIRNLESQFNISRMLNIGTPVGSLDKNALETEITQLKDNITSLRIKNDGYKIEIANQTQRYLELSKANTHLRTTSLEKIATQKAEIATLKAEAVGKKNSRPTGTPTKHKVLALGMYTKSSKYIPPQKRADWVQPTLLPKKKQVTFLEPHKTSPRPTQKAPVQHKKPTVPVNMFPKAKPTTEARKPIPKRNTLNHNPLPAKSVKARRAEDYYKNLYVDISQFVDRFTKSVHTKPHQAKHVVNTSTNA
nr:hypothetical protein [Tanacetum cinerariifolium]